MQTQFQDKNYSIWKISRCRKRLTKSKSENTHSAEKSGKLRNTCKKLAHTHRFEHQPSGLKSKHLTTRPRKPELCSLPVETSCRAEKTHQHIPITLVKTVYKDYFS